MGTRQRARRLELGPDGALTWQGGAPGSRGKRERLPYKKRPERRPRDSLCAAR